MPPSPSRTLLLSALLGLAGAAGVGAQELPLKRAVPAIMWDGCAPEAGRPASAPPRDHGEAARLTTEATQAAILGDNEAALDLLTRAVALDPASPEATYRLARTLEEVERTDEAVALYCRYLALAPDAGDAGEARSRLADLTAPEGYAVPRTAASAFRAGLDHFDAGAYEAAASAFETAAAAAPDWGDALYNRGIARLALGRSADAAADLRAYLERDPGAADFDAVLDVLGPLRGGDAPASPQRTLAAGLLVPGLGHFTTGRPARGAVVLGVAAAAVAAGVAVQRVEVTCRVDPADGVCAPMDVLGEETRRPYLAAGIGVAVLAGAIGAWDAWRQVRRDRAGLVGGTAEAGAASAGLALEAPTVRTEGALVHLDLLRIRFGGGRRP